ncbi:hypothetical protein Q0590_08690 [Rhodocytophaga aerolata]|uniref:YcxB family protein n=1 Tax=Rhodocytophaga aerolata TaxID=455078 RepID=A0ABT8R2K3_9BACT|nr:hypothetical protein [Rhodocytophaga aerolata]MDO1446325.1 hypothetical protein [Rhodocytophaga aerolata]
MRSELVITKKDYTRFYLYQYYHSPNLLTRILRYICGPVLVAMGIHLLSYPQKFGIAYGGFCIGYGIYYTAKPFLFLLFKKFTPQSGFLEVKDTHLLFESKEGKSLVDLTKVKSYKTTSFFVIKLENNHSVIIPKEKLSLEVKEELERKIQAGI